METKLPATPTSPTAPTSAPLPHQAVQPGTTGPAVIHPLNVSPEKGPTPMNAKVMIILLVIAAVAGGGTGYGVHRLMAKSSSGAGGSQVLQQVAGENIKVGDIFGSPDESTFKDKAEGYLEIGGIEGSHHLLRPGGESQTVYLTSSITDLDKFKGMEIRVWGETFKGQNVGWLMDVGRVEVLNTQAQPPADAAKSEELEEIGE